MPPQGPPTPFLAMQPKHIEQALISGVTRELFAVFALEQRQSKPR
jgi:hypothetical protein